MILCTLLCMQLAYGYPDPTKYHRAGKFRNLCRICDSEELNNNYDIVVSSILDSSSIIQPRCLVANLKF